MAAVAAYQEQLGQASHSCQSRSARCSFPDLSCWPAWDPAQCQVLCKPALRSLHCLRSTFGHMLSGRTDQLCISLSDNLRAGGRVHSCTAQLSYFCLLHRLQVDLLTELALRCREPAGEEGHGDLLSLTARAGQHRGWRRTWRGQLHVTSLTALCQVYRADS